LGAATLRSLRNSAPLGSRVILLGPCINRLPAIDAVMLILLRRSPKQMLGIKPLICRALSG